MPASHAGDWGSNPHISILDMRLISYNLKILVFGLFGSLFAVCFYSRASRIIHMNFSEIYFGFVRYFCVMNRELF